ncbi:MEDS domain-containing protein [Micromonospora sp. NBS 11-29]|uniref:MEDS domain-containing protein n=1 Tax=Micromonospora sp. NBS 11-29 TaxID=1960879 RepID=UPI000B77515C|nr:MEDS domain-containing protein [Micromonospora sp. NBS 11-29]
MTCGGATDPGYGHACFAYDDPAALHARAVEQVTLGLAAGEQVWLVGPEEPDVVATRLGSVPGFDTALRRGDVRLLAVGQAYRHDAVVDPARQVQAYVRATAESLAAGHTGLRVLAEATDMVRTAGQRDAFARYEHRMDHWMRHHPMAATCAYDRRVLGDAAISELACLHPEGNGDVPFRLHAGSGDAVVAIRGELDASDDRLFAAALERADPQPAAGRLVVDACHLRFIDHRGLFHLRDLARRHGAVVVLRTRRPALARLVALLDLAELRVVVVR